MPEKVSDFIVRRLHDWGIRRIFGYPGDGINGILGSLNQADGRMEFIQVRHEEMAAMMACAHAKFTGEVGVCLATSGPGAIHLLNGLYDAKLDHQPVVAIVGQQARMSLGGHYQQEVDLMSLFKDVAGDYVQMATEPAQIRHLIDRAIRIAKAQRTVTAIIIPNDVQLLESQEPPHEHHSVHTGIGYTQPRILPRQEQLVEAARVLNEGKQVAILVGAGALQAEAEVVETADRLGAGVAKALLGKAALPDGLPFVTGAIGFFGTKASHRMMNECDTLLMIGSSFPYAEFLPKEGQARGVQIDIDGRMLSLRYPMEVNLPGDTQETLRALIPLLNRKEDRSWQQSIEQHIRDWRRELDEMAEKPANPLNPRLVFRELSSRLPDRCIICADSGSTATWTAQYLRIRRGMQYSLSGTLATMGSAVPYAIAAKFAHPDRLVIACAGDGAMQMNGNEELITISKYWRQWANPQLIVLVVNNRDLNFVTWEQRLMQGNPKYNASQQIPDFGYARYAESLGLAGIRIDAPEQLTDALEQALRADRPVVLEAVTDPEILVFTPDVALKYSEKLAEAIEKGDAAAGTELDSPLKEAVDQRRAEGT